MILKRKMSRKILKGKNRRKYGIQIGRFRRNLVERRLKTRVVHHINREVDRVILRRNNHIENESQVAVLQEGKAKQET